jgi:death-on-curing protein
VASAYLFYLCQNHPFIDGNKRAALGACLVFLRLNDRKPPADGPAWEELTLAVASSRLDRGQTTHRLRKLLKAAKK